MLDITLAGHTVAAFLSILGIVVAALVLLAAVIGVAIDAVRWARWRSHQAEPPRRRGLDGRSGAMRGPDRLRGSHEAPAR